METTRLRAADLFAKGLSQADIGRELGVSPPDGLGLAHAISEDLVYPARSVFGGRHFLIVVGGGCLLIGSME